MTRASRAGRTGRGLYSHYEIVWRDATGSDRKSVGHTSKRRAILSAREMIDSGAAIWAEVRTDSFSSLPVQVLWHGSRACG